MPGNSKAKMAALSNDDCAVLATLFFKQRFKNAQMISKRRRQRLRTILEMDHQRKRNILIMYIMINTAILIQNLVRDRKIWVAPRTRYFWNQTIYGSFTEENWLMNFRMTKETFTYLCNLLRPYLQKKDTRFRKSLPVEIRVAVALYRLGNPQKYSVISSLFGIGRSTVGMMVRTVCSALCDLKENFISIPRNLNKVIELLSSFSVFGLTNCAGVLGTTHLPIVPPEQNPQKYLNSKSWHSLSLQAWVDHDGRFVDVHVGEGGSLSNAEVLEKTNLYQQAETGILFPKLTNARTDEDEIIQIVTNETFPSKEWLSTSAVDCSQMDDDEISSNAKLVAVNTIIQNTFTRLKGRWQILLKKNDMDLTLIPKVIEACCVLHNICETFDSHSFFLEWLHEAIEADVAYPQPHDIYNAEQ